MLSQKQGGEAALHVWSEVLESGRQDPLLRQQRFRCRGPARHPVIPSQGKDALPQPARCAQFYYLDAFILSSSGPEVRLLRHHVDARRDALRR